MALEGINVGRALNLHSAAIQEIEKGYDSMNLYKGKAILWMNDFPNLSLKEKENIHNTLIKEYDTCVKARDLTRNLPELLKKVAGGDVDAIAIANEFCKNYSILPREAVRSSEEESLESEAALKLAEAHLNQLTSRIETMWKPLMEQRHDEFAATLDPLFAKIRNDRGFGSALYGLAFTNHVSLNAAHQELKEGKSFTVGTEETKRAELEKESKLNQALQMLPTPESEASSSSAGAPNLEAGSYQSEVLTDVVSSLLASMSRLGSGANYLMEKLLEETPSAPPASSPAPTPSAASNEEGKAEEKVANL